MSPSRHSSRVPSPVGSNAKGLRGRVGHERMIGRERDLVLLGVPSSAGAYGPGQEKAPQALREAGLVELLRGSGRHVLDVGDLPPVRFTADDEHPHTRSLAAVREVVRTTARRTRRLVSSGSKPIVIGGDCTITLGVVAGMLGVDPQLRLAYLDGDVDLETPETTPSGIFDGMVVAHLLGLGSPELSKVGPRVPLLEEKDIALFGYNDQSEWFVAPEREMLTHLRSPAFPCRRISLNPSAVAAEALRALRPAGRRLLVHFDTDVMDAEDFPAAELSHREGLSLDQTMQCLRVFVRDPTFDGLVVTEFNPDKDPTGRHAVRLANGLADALAMT